MWFSRPGVELADLGLQRLSDILDPKFGRQFDMPRFPRITAVRKRHRMQATGWRGMNLHGTGAAHGGDRICG